MLALEITHDLVNLDMGSPIRGLRPKVDRLHMRINRRPLPGPSSSERRRVGRPCPALPYRWPT